MIDINEIALTHQPENPENTGQNPPPKAAAAVQQPDDELKPASEPQQKLLQEVETWKSRCATLAAERELAVALTGQPLLPGVAGQLIELLKSKIVSSPNERQGFDVKSADGRGLADAVRDWLNKPEFQHFRQAITKGGTATRTESAATERLVSTSQPARSLNEIVIQQWRQRSSRPSSSNGWPQSGS